MSLFAFPASVALPSNETKQDCRFMATVCLSGVSCRTLTSPEKPQGGVRVCFCPRVLYAKPHADLSGTRTQLFFGVCFTAHDQTSTRFMFMSNHSIERASTICSTRFGAIRALQRVGPWMSNDEADRLVSLARAPAFPRTRAWSAYLYVAFAASVAMGCAHTDMCAPGRQSAPCCFVHIGSSNDRSCACHGTWLHPGVRCNLSCLCVR